MPAKAFGPNRNGNVTFCNEPSQVVVIHVVELCFFIDTCCCFDIDVVADDEVNVANDD